MEYLIIALIYLLPIIFVYRNSRKSNRSIAWTVGSIVIPVILPIIYFLTLGKHKEKQKRAGVLFTYLAGITDANANGMDRKNIIVQSGKGAKLQLQREPNNPSDPNAVAVYTVEGKQIGYLNKVDAREIAKLLDAGVTIDARIVDITRDRDHDVKRCQIRLMRKKTKKVS